MNGGLVIYTDPHGRRRSCPTSYGSTCKSRACPRCGVSWAKDQRKRLIGNLEACQGAVTVIAVTGPGADLLPCSDATCGGRGEHKQNGKKGCRVDPARLRSWCETMPYRWTRLRDAARRRVVRQGLTIPQRCRVWEVQRRGVPHVHVVVPFGTDDERAAAQLFADALSELAPRWGFGNVDRGEWNPETRERELVAWDGARAGEYLAGYFLGGRKGKPELREAVREAPAGGFFPRLPANLVWIARDLTKATMLTMRNLRRLRHLIAAAKGLCAWPKWRDLDECLQVRELYAGAMGRRAPPPPRNAIDEDEFESTRAWWAGMIAASDAARDGAILAAAA